MAIRDPLKSFYLFIEPSPKRIRVKFAGQVVADSQGVLIVHERGYPPVYYFPLASIRQEFLHPSDLMTHCSVKGNARYWHLKMGENWSDNAVWRYAAPSTEAGTMLENYYAFDWQAVDEWYEEEEQMFMHPHARDPYKRIEVVRSSRRVRVVIDGKVIADSQHPIIVFETGAPLRYYLPEHDIQMQYLVPSQRKTYCPYRGETKHWSVAVGDTTHSEVAWVLPHPQPGFTKLAGLIAFFQERVEYFEVDGEQVLEAEHGASVLDYLSGGYFFSDISTR